MQYASPESPSEHLFARANPKPRPEDPDRSWKARGIKAEHGQVLHMLGQQKGATFQYQNPVAVGFVIME